MPLSAADLAWVRSQVGTTTPPTDADLDAIWDRLENRDAVALEVLDGRLATMVATAAKFDLSGDLSVDLTKNIEALREKVAQLQGSVSAAADGAPVPWAGGLTWSERDYRDPDLVDPYFHEDMGTVAVGDARRGC